MSRNSLRRVEPNFYRCSDITLFSKDDRHFRGFPVVTPNSASALASRLTDDHKSTRTRVILILNTNIKIDHGT